MFPLESLAAIKFPTPNKILCLRILEAPTLAHDQQKINAGIDKNSIPANYNGSCIKKGITSKVSTIVKGEKSPTEHPSHHCLIANYKMKPSSTLYYWAIILHFDNVVIFLIKWHKLYLMDDNLKGLQCLNKKYCEIINNVLQLKLINFSS